MGKLKRHKGENVFAASLSNREHSGPFLTAPDEVLSPAEIGRIERAYNEDPSSLPPEIRYRMDEGRRKIDRFMAAMGGGKPKWTHSVSKFDEILWVGKANSLMGDSKKEVFMLDGNDCLVNYVYDHSNFPKTVFRREIKVDKCDIKRLKKDLNGNSGSSDYTVLLSLFESQKHYDAQRVRKRGYTPKLNVTVGEPDSYHPKQWEGRY